MPTPDSGTAPAAAAGWRADDGLVDWWIGELADWLVVDLCVRSRFVREMEMPKCKPVTTRSSRPSSFLRQRGAFPLAVPVQAAPPPTHTPASHHTPAVLTAAIDWPKQIIDGHRHASSLPVWAVGVSPSLSLFPNVTLSPSSAWWPFPPPVSDVLC